MSDLNFGDGSWEDARGIVQNSLQELVTLIKGNGKEGLHLTLTNFITEYRTNRENNIKFQNQRDKENAVREARRWQLAGTILAVLSLLVGWLTYRDSQRKLSAQPVVPGIQSSQPAPQTAHEPMPPVPNTP